MIDEMRAEIRQSQIDFTTHKFRGYWSYLFDLDFYRSDGEGGSNFYICTEAEAFDELLGNIQYCLFVLYILNEGKLPI